MASASSSTPGSIQLIQPTIRKINDALYELYEPATGSAEIEIIFFHGLQPQDHSDAYLKTWMVADDSECWLNTWLAEDFPQARILSVTYDSSTEVSATSGRMDMYMIGERLTQSLIGFKRIGQNCPVVLVGHGIGGLVLKEVCLQAMQMGAMHMDRGTNPYDNPYEIFLGNMKGIFFYSTPNSGLGSGVMLSTSNQRGPLLEYLELYSKDAARLNETFGRLRRRHGWKTSGVTIGKSDETEASSSIVRTPYPTSRFNRYDMDDFRVLSWEDNFSICKPRDRSSSNYQYLVEVLQEVLQNEENLRIDRRSTVGMPPNPMEALRFNSPTSNGAADNHHRYMRSLWSKLTSLPLQIVHLVLTLFVSFMHLCTSLWMDISHFLMGTVDGAVILGVFVNTLSFLVLAYKMYIGIPFLAISLLLLVIRRRREANSSSSSSTAAAPDSVGQFGSFFRRQRVL